MCETQNDKDAQSCKYCGYLFEDHGDLTSSNPSGYSTSKLQETPSSDKVIDPTRVSDSSTIVSPQQQSDATVPSGSPLFVASKSLYGSILPAVVYFLVFGSLGSFSTISFFTIALIALLVLVVVVPILTTPRKYLFYNNSLRIHKIVGGDSEISYSDLTLYDIPPGSRRPRIVLSVKGQRRPTGIPGNPTNKELGQNLYQFLERNLQKYNPRKGAEEPAVTTTDTNDTDNNMNSPES